MLTMLMAALLVPVSAEAREGDEEACEGLAAGDPCTRANGDEGVCQPDDSDPGVLECDDDPWTSTGGTSTGGTSTGGTASGSECDGLAVGDPCVRDDGRDGFCKPDDSDPGVLECDDDSGSTSDDAPSTDDSTGSSSSGSAGCDGLVEGDLCTRDDGRPGVCQPDASDPTLLECDDDLVSALTACSAVDGRAAGWLALGLIAAIGRRSKR